MFGPTKEEMGPKPPKMVVISFVLHSVKGRVIKSIFLQTKNVQNWMFDPGWWWAHKRRLELFAQVSAIHHKVLISESKITKYCMCCLFWLTMQILSFVIDFCANTNVFFVLLGSGLSTCKKWWNYWYIEVPDINVPTFENKTWMNSNKILEVTHSYY